MEVKLVPTTPAGESFFFYMLTCGSPPSIMHSSFGRVIHHCCPIGLEKRETQIDGIIEISMRVCVCVSDQLRCILRYLVFRPNTRFASLTRIPESRSREACRGCPDRPGRR